MSTTLDVIAYFEDNEDFRKKADAFKACVAAGVDPPDALSAFDPGDIGKDAPGPLFDLNAGRDDEHPAVSKYLGIGQGGFEVDISKLPKGIRYLRFVSSW